MIVVLASVMLLVAAWGFGFTAGMNKARRDERQRMRLRERYR